MSGGYLGKFDRAGWWEKTCPDFFSEDSGEPSATWPRSGTMLAGRCYERPTSALRTGGIASSSWPTPDAYVSNDRESPESFHTRRETLRAKGINGNGAGTPLAIASKQWPTLAARDWRSGEASPETMARNAGSLNEIATQQSATPTGHPRTHTPRDVHHGVQLANQADMWISRPGPPAPPTPQAGTLFSGAGPSSPRRWATPGTTDVGTGMPDRPDRPRSPGNLRDDVAQVNGTPARLNPRFVAWMMGLRPDTLDAAPLTRRQRLAMLGNGVVPQQAEAALVALLAAGPEDYHNADP